MKNITGLPENWDEAADVVIVGYGGAGAIAAITAADAGASVIVLEKSPALANLKLTGGTGPVVQISGGGGNTHISTGVIVAPRNVADATAYLYAASGGLTPRGVCAAWAEEVCKNESWFKEMGIMGSIPQRPRNTEYPNLPGASAMTPFHVSGNGPNFFARLDKHVQDRGIKVIFSTRGKELIRNFSTGEIVGVKAENNGKFISVKARKGVVLCTGGFEFNEDMKNRFLKIWPMKFYGWEYNTGDGIIMAQKVGADLWNMDVVVGGNCSWFDDPEYKFSFTTRPKSNNYLWVNKFGSRFCNEPGARNPHGGWVIHIEINDKNVGFSRVPSYLVFDETARLAGPIGADEAIKGGHYMGHILLPIELGGYDGWSQDNLKEIDRGWIKKGNTIEALAVAIGSEMDASKLKAAIDTFNSYCASGSDKEFGRNPQEMQPLNNPPYFAVPLYPGLVCTCGGPVRSAKAEVLDPDRKPIPRLYEAGNCGSIYGRTYSVTGGNLGDVCAFGRIAGRSVAALDTWD
jgi:hypothetical protein